MISTLADLLRICDTYTCYLKSHQIQFDPQGFPILERNMFLQEWPDLLTTHKDRQAWFVEEPAHTAICFFTEDKRIYPRFHRIFSDIIDYREYMGVIGADITVTEDMDVEWRRFTMLLNALHVAVLAVNAIPIIPNIRNAGSETLDMLNWIPRGVLVATSTLGCEQTKTSCDLSFEEKLLHLLPSGVLFYGKRDCVMEEQTKRLGIPFQRYDDVHMIHRRKKKAV